LRKSDAQTTEFDVEDTVPLLASHLKTSSNSWPDLLPSYLGDAAVPKPGEKVSSLPCDTLLTKVLKVGQSISIQNIEGADRGIVSNTSMLKSQYICHYDGDRVDATMGEILMRCKRTSQNIKKLSPFIQQQLCSLEYVKNWAVTLNRGSNIKKCGGTHNIVIDGTIAASALLDSLVDRGLIGSGALMNSSNGTGTGKAPNCILIFVPWHQDDYCDQVGADRINNEQITNSLSPNARTVMSAQS
jgi:hypothetical protein